MKLGELEMRTVKKEDIIHKSDEELRAIIKHFKLHQFKLDGVFDAELVPESLDREKMLQMIEKAEVKVMIL